ncbi:MAG: hypothetical protein QOF13_652 [Solirubrobacterales bacterium]|nr:hypothetical protein [Solirubrobacterales bacterium]
MTSRQFWIGGLVLAAAFAALGIWALAEAKYHECRQREGLIS